VRVGDRMNNPIIATEIEGMVNIDGDNIAYANIRHMYKVGDGVGIQTSLEDNKEAKEICNAIAMLMYELRAALNE